MNTHRPRLLSLLIWICINFHLVGDNSADNENKFRIRSNFPLCRFAYGENFVERRKRQPNRIAHTKDNTKCCASNSLELNYFDFQWHTCDADTLPLFDTGTGNTAINDHSRSSYRCSLTKFIQRASVLMQFSSWVTIWLLWSLESFKQLTEKRNAEKSFSSRRSGRLPVMDAKHNQAFLLKLSTRTGFCAAFMLCTLWNT